jgi:4-amino-4-deoxy-L-arabinose transferase-like glycosyltransferase
LIGYPNDGNISSPVPYLYHPPFDFYLKGVWFTLVGASGPFEDITAGRILSGIESLISLIIAYFCMLEIAGKKGAVIGLLLLATDGWLIYTSRLNLIENAMMPLGMFGVWMYVRATKSKKTIYYLLAGCFLAFAVVYKHTGIPFLMVPIINLVVITHQDWKKSPTAHRNNIYCGFDISCRHATCLERGLYIPNMGADRTCSGSLPFEGFEL